MGLLDAPGLSPRTFKTLRRRELPGVRALPTVMATPPTLTPGVANAASTLTSAVLHRPDSPGKFRTHGTTPWVPAATSPGLDSIRSTIPAAGSTMPTWAVEFDLDSVLGAFEVKVVGQNQGVRVLVWLGGGWQQVSVGATFSHGADGQEYKDKVDFGVGGTYRIRIEMGFNTWFEGILTGPTDSVTAAGHAGRRIVIMGDSYTEPVIIDTGTQFQWDGYAQLLNYLTGCEVIPCAIGGTGYLGTNGGTKPKYRDRLADLYAYAPDEVWWMSSLNDRTLGASAIATEAALCWSAAAANLPGVKQVVWGPAWPQGHQTVPATLYDMADAIKAAAATAGLQYLEILRAVPEVKTFANTTLAAAAAVNASSISVTAAIPNNTYLMIGASSAKEVRRAGSVSGTGPYSVPLDSVLGQAHSAGEVITMSGPNIVTGSGRQTATNGNGSADRLSGSDATHPTKAGHRAIAMNMYRLYAATLAP